MKKIRAAIVGYGNIGKYALQALESAPDFEVAGVVRRSGAENKPAELNNYPVVKEISELKDVDVAILSTPTFPIVPHRVYGAALPYKTTCNFLKSFTPAPKFKATCVFLASTFSQSTSLKLKKKSLILKTI